MPKEMRVFISRIRHEGKIIDPEPGTVVHRGDVIAVITRTEALMERGTEIGPEVNDKALIDFPAELLDVVITNKAWAGKTLKELAAYRVCPRGFPQETRAGRGADAIYSRDPA